MTVPSFHWKKCFAAQVAVVGLIMELDVDRRAWKAALAEEKHRELAVERAIEEYWEVERVAAKAKAALEKCLEGISGSG